METILGASLPSCDGIVVILPGLGLILWEFIHTTIYLIFELSKIEIVTAGSGITLLYKMGNKYSGAYKLQQKLAEVPP
jgi:hypothetical protein